LFLCSKAAISVMCRVLLSRNINLVGLPTLFEKMVCNRITLVVYPVISDAQHGFVKGHSTVSNLVQLDRVFHGLLKFNFPILFGGLLLCWMGSYLTGRTQRDKLDDYLSESTQCHSIRVLQGSHLGPIFFILDI
jgi:hypothetical protein